MLIATRNAHKVGEIRTILGPGFQLLTLEAFPQAPKVIEDAETFAGNAAKKATELAKWLGKAEIRNSKSKIQFVLADDSGLEVDALNGAPGVNSARFAAMDKLENASDAANNAKLMKLLAGVPLAKRSARFRCVIALVPVPEAKAEGASPVCYADELEARTFDGACEGHIQLAAAGGGGFGYDPLFVPDGFTQSFAELGEGTKNRLSHRGKALTKLKVYLGGKSKGQRNAFKMKLKPGNVAEYKKRHDEIWPELQKELRAAGISDYSIFMDEETLTLFAVQKLTDDNTAASLPQHPVVRKWWDYMAPLMETHADHSPVATPLREVFYLE